MMKGSSDDKAAIEAVIQRLPEAWNKRDARLLASAFTDPTDYVAVEGFLLPNWAAEDNAAVHDRLWQTRFAEGSAIRFEILKIEELVPGVALAIAKNHNDYMEAGKPSSHDSIITLVLIKTNEGWRIRQFNNNLVSS